MSMIRSRSNSRLGHGTVEVFRLPTLLGSRTNSRNSRTFVSDKSSAEDPSITRDAPALRKGALSAQKGCVWDANRSENSLCKGEDLLKHIKHIKINNEAEKGLTLTEVCRISMRTKEFLSRSLQWLDSAMAELHLHTNALGRVTEEDFVKVLRPFTEGILDLKERHMLFSRLDGENKGSVLLQLTDSEHKKSEELKCMRKTSEHVVKINQVISAMQSQVSDVSLSPSKCQQNPIGKMELLIEEAEQDAKTKAPRDPVVASGIAEVPVGQPQSVDVSMSLLESQTEPIEEIKQAAETEAPADQMIASCIAEVPESDLSSSCVEHLNESHIVTSNIDDAELQQLESRLEELRSMQAERLRRRRKRELEAEIKALQLELEAKTPKASTPHAAESACSSASKVSFALPSTLTEP